MHSKPSDFVAVLFLFFLWWHQILVSLYWVLLACHAQNLADFCFSFWCEVDKNILVHTGKWSQNVLAFWELYLLVQGMLPAEKLTSAPADHRWTPFRFHDWFSGRWDLPWCRCHHQHLPSFAWKGSGSSCHRFSALCTFLLEASCRFISSSEHCCSFFFFFFRKKKNV